MGYTPVAKTCPCCDVEFTGHPNKRFCSQFCKDRWHNSTNPRGYQAGLFEPHEPKTRREQLEEESVDYEGSGWDAHKDVHL